MQDLMQMFDILDVRNPNPLPSSRGLQGFPQCVETAGDAQQGCIAGVHRGAVTSERPGHCFDVRRSNCDIPKSAPIFGGETCLGGPQVELATSMGGSGAGAIIVIHLLHLKAVVVAIHGLQLNPS